MLSSPILPVILGVLIAGSLMAFLAEKVSPRASGLFSTLLLAAAFCLSVTVDMKEGAFYLLFEAPYLGQANLFADGMSSVFLIVTLALSSVICLYAAKFMETTRQKGFFGSYLLYVTGLAGIFMSSNLLLFFMFFELMLIASWVLIGFWGGEGRRTAALKYFLYTEFGALLLLLGIFILSSVTGTFDLLSMGSTPPLTRELMLSVALISLGVLIKSAAFPLHSWLPDTYCEAPHPVSSLLSFATMAVGGYALIRLFQSFAPSAFTNPYLALALAGVGLVNILFGGLTAISQNDMRRLLAYSSISQVGYMLVGVASASVLGALGVVLWAVAHGFAKSSLFMISGIYGKVLGTENLKDLSGLASRMPITSSMLLTSFLSLAGIPPLLGFWGETFIFLAFAYNAVASSFDPAKFAIVVIGVISTVITAGYGLWAVRRALYGIPNEIAEKSKDPSALLWIPLLLLSIALCILGIYPAILSQFFWIFVP